MKPTKVEFPCGTIIYVPINKGYEAFSVRKCPLHGDSDYCYTALKSPNRMIKCELVKNVLIEHGARWTTSKSAEKLFESAIKELNL